MFSCLVDPPPPPFPSSPLKDKFWILDSTPYYMREALRLTEEGFEATEVLTVLVHVRGVLLGRWRDQVELGEGSEPGWAGTRTIFLFILSIADQHRCSSSAAGEDEPVRVSDTFRGFWVPAGTSCPASLMIPRDIPAIGWVPSPDPSCHCGPDRCVDSARASNGPPLLSRRTY